MISNYGIGIVINGIHYMVNADTYSDAWTIYALIRQMVAAGTEVYIVDNSTGEIFADNQFD